MDTLAPPTTPIVTRISTAADVLDGLVLEDVEKVTLFELGVDFRGGAVGIAEFAALAWLQARRTSHPGISWVDAEPLILIALT